MFTAFPDAAFEIVSIGDTGGGLVATQWLARATNTGPLAGASPPTGRLLTLPGASFTQVESDKIRSEQVYHDRQTMADFFSIRSSVDPLAGDTAICFSEQIWERLCGLPQSLVSYIDLVLVEAPSPRCTNSTPA